MLSLDNLLARKGIFQWLALNPLPDDKIVDLSKLKAIADDHLNVGHMMKFVLDRMKKKNIAGKGENADNHHFLIFPQ